jgi:N-acyl-D-amino-acid deacylase
MKGRAFRADALGAGGTTQGDMMHDVAIRGGTVVDGTGRPGVKADVAIEKGRVAAIGQVGPAREDIDAKGQVVAPGFIDVHTHYDAQYTWDPYATSSIWHGVTTTVIGNCGFAIAPCRPADRDVTLRTLMKVEGMSLKAMQTGITWGFETFPQYLDHLERCNPALNVAALVGHSSIRQWVLGADAQKRPATADEIRTMSGMVEEAMAAGAIGLGSSTAEAHVGDKGLPVPSRLAELKELQALTEAMGKSGKGLFEITIGTGTQLEDLRDIQQRSHRPVVWAAFFHRDDRPEATPQRLAQTEAFIRAGVEVRPQVSPRPLTMDFTMAYPYPFEGMAVWQRVMQRPANEWPAVYADTEFRNALKAELAAKRFAVFRGRWDLVTVLKAANPKLQKHVGRSIGEIAADTGKDPVDAWLDLVLDDELKTEFVAGLMNVDDAAVGDLVSHPHTLVSLSDAGAHLSLLCDAGYSSTLLGKWVRSKHRLTLEEAVRRLTSDPAQAYRIPERGTLKPGYWADVVVFDPATIDAEAPEFVHDLPGGEPRFISRARGISHSLVNGVPVLRKGEVLERPAGKRPGQLLRKFDS